MEKYLLTIQSDTNDADFIYANHIFETPSQLALLPKLKVALKKVKIKNEEDGNKYDISWPTDQAADANELEDYYKNVLTLNEIELVNDFIPYYENSYGIISIGNVTIYKVVKEECVI
jgi:hypothetical protein